MSREYVIFKLNSEYYGIDIKYVENIEKNLTITRVPNSKPYVKGIINLRGNVIPVIDLRLRYGIEPKEYTEESRIIIVNFESYQIGMIVDSSSETLQLEEENIDASPNMRSSSDEEFIKELGKHNNRIIMLINLKRTLGIIDDEM